MLGYRGPINLKTFDRLDWMSSDAGLEAPVRRHGPLPRPPCHHREMAAGLAIADERSIQAALLGANPEGLFKLPD